LSQAQRFAAWEQNGIEDRLRLYPKTDPYLKHLNEYRALLAIHQQFGSSDCESRFDAIRPLEALAYPHALVMEKSRSRNFGSTWRSANRLQHRFFGADVGTVMRRAGQWLRIFHGMAPLEHTRPRSEERDDFLESVERFSINLAESGYEARFFRGLPRRVASLAADLPSELPLGLSHNDFAPRNILLAADGRVTVFDTQARWQAPIYEDLAHFLIALQASGVQVCTAGAWYDRRLLSRCEASFLEGYFADQPAPLPAVRLFQCLLLLERLAALVCRYRTARGWRRTVKGCRWALWRRYCVGQIRRSLDETEASYVV
jgi:aminoglycoside phosphotransferase (APT) family kinase protein